QAIQRAPRVESGDVSTMCAPTFTVEIKAMAYATCPGVPMMPRLLINPGTSGKNIGITTPEELE
ncbi:MAG TPA: hypothetical protein PLZ19_06010, partial [Thermosynergistes sp.]|nr:hypothetical protein [Thermosynergistes sp.]